MGLYSDYIFPTFFDWVVPHKGFDEKREEVLKQAQGKILEIGIGTGLNLDYYPKEISEIWAVDPNAGMQRELNRKLAKREIKVNFFLAPAEKLPFDNGEFNTVVSTLTMCTIPNLQKGLTEIRRVLKPNGKFIFLEHGLSHDSNVARLQRFLNPVQNVIGCGCKLNVDAEAELAKAGFRIASMNKNYIPHYPKILSFVYQGVAL